MKPFRKSVMGPLDGSIGSRFGEDITWYRRMWGNYYMFCYEWDAYSIRVYVNRYNPDVWQDEWVEIHHFDSYTVGQWTKRPQED